MIKNYGFIKQFVLLFVLFQISILSGCTNSMNNEEVEKVNYNENHLDRNELMEDILKLNPYLEEDLEELSTEELQDIHEELTSNREQRIKDRLKEIDESEQLDEEDMKHHHDPNPPQPPIYERPEPVPDPPIEDN